jgi:hypothetical protein
MVICYIKDGCSKLKGVYNKDLLVLRKVVTLTTWAELRVDSNYLF